MECFYKELVACFGVSNEKIFAQRCIKEIGFLLDDAKVFGGTIAKCAGGTKLDSVRGVIIMSAVF